MRNNDVYWGSCRRAAQLPTLEISAPYTANLIKITMGCDCCKSATPQWYRRCRLENGDKVGRRYHAPCGYVYEADGHGSNYTPPKKRKKRKK